MSYVHTCQRIEGASNMYAALTPASLLSWSPNGEYMLEGSIDGSFRIWESHKWADAAWASQVLRHGHQVYHLSAYDLE